MPRGPTPVPVTANNGPLSRLNEKLHRALNGPCVAKMFPSLSWKGNVEAGGVQQVMVVVKTLGMLVLSPGQGQDRSRGPSRDGPRCAELAVRCLQVHLVPAHLGACEALSFPFLLARKGIPFLGGGDNCLANSSSPGSRESVVFKYPRRSKPGWQR